MTQREDGFSNVERSQWEDIPLDHIGENVELETVTYSEDFRGDLTASFSTKKQIRVIFTQRSITHVRDKEGYTKKIPAKMQTRIDDNVQKGDRITVGDTQWKVFNVINRRGLFNQTDLYLWGDA